MSTKSAPIENQEFPADDFNQDLGGDFNQDSGYDEFAQYEVPEVVKSQRKKR